jgi:hypothetical protein
MADLTEWLREALDTCIERGMQLPFIVCSISPNGSVVCMRVHGMGRDPDILAEHYETVFRTPITIAVVDQTGEAVRITVGPDTKGLTVH